MYVSTRRRLIRAALASATVLLLAGAARAQQKMTRKEADYQDTPKAGILMCGTCRLFEPPRGCKVVEGDVSPQGWCKAFDLAD
jgi:hypothetical protein